MEKESIITDFQDNIAYWLENITQNVSKAVTEVTFPYSFTWRDIEFLRAVRNAEGGVPLTKILYPNGQSGLDSKTGQDLFQMFKDAGFLEIRHSEDGPVMVELNEVGAAYVDSRLEQYHELNQKLSNAVSESFLKDLKAMWKVLTAKGQKA